MKALFFVLNHIEKLNVILEALSERGIKGGTILNSTGMAHELSEDEEYHFGGLRQILTPERKNSKTLVFVAKEENIDIIIQTIQDYIDLDEPDTGMIFVLDVYKTLGQNKRKIN